MFLICSQDPGTLPAHLEYPSLHCIKEIGISVRTSIVFLRVHPLVFIKRASRSLTKTGFWLAKASKLRSMLDLCWSSSWEASWSGLGAILGGLWEAMTAPRRPQNGPRRPQDAPRRDHDGPRWPQDAPKMLRRRSQDAFKTEAEARCASEA